LGFNLIHVRRRGRTPCAISPRLWRVCSAPQRNDGRVQREKLMLETKLSFAVLGAGIFKKLSFAVRLFSQDRTVYPLVLCLASLNLEIGVSLPEAVALCSSSAL
jgi:hypothetical protein